ncbi:hypothetical protein EG329_007704 [Mollisiaceae sp. DMI_Dod_QoI]|nr:hypothetical protein EG329_007704 [Helotiales sp. DMI_Dod_QoI]
MEGTKGKERDDDLKQKFRENGDMWAYIMTVLGRTPSLRSLSHPIKIFQTDPKKNFNIDVQLEKAVHGYLLADKKKRASLLVFGVQLVSLRRNTPFKRLKLEAKIIELQGPPTSRPEILAHAPFVFEEALKVSKVPVETGSEVQMTSDVEVNVGVGKVKFGRKVIGGKQSESVEVYFAKGASAICEDGDGKRSKVWWNVKQSTVPNSKDNAGIDPNYRFAVLLARGKDDKAPYRVKIDLEVHAGWEYLFEHGLSNTIHAKDLDIDPRTWHVGVDPRSINREKLGLFEKPEYLASLTKSAR